MKRYDLSGADVVGQTPDMVQVGVGNKNVPLKDAPLGATSRVKHHIELRQNYARLLPQHLHLRSQRALRARS